MKKSIRMAGICLLLAVAVLLSCEGSDIGEAVQPTNAKSEDHVMRVLLLGCDRTAELTDSIMLVSLNSATHQASILQIPRDTYAEYTNRDYKKLNGAFNAMGAKKLKGFLEEALGVEIDCYVVIHPDALVSVVDAVGGVDIEIERDMEYSDPAQGLEIHLSAGNRHLSGAEAEQFVRYRSGYANADLGRLDAQKLFLKALAKKCKSISYMQMLKAAFGSMTSIRTDIGIGQIGSIVSTLRACDPDSTPMVTLSGRAAQGHSGAWYYILNRERALETVNRYLMPTTPIEDASFDPRRVFDREENELFHKIYTVSGEALDTMD